MFRSLPRRRLVNDRWALNKLVRTTIEEVVSRVFNFPDFANDQRESRRFGGGVAPLGKSP